MTMELFDRLEAPVPARVDLGPGAVVLRGFATADAEALLTALRQVIAQAPWRHMVTPGGLPMSVAMTNCGALGWISDRAGYRYAALDPANGRPWPTMPAVFLRVARAAAAAADYADFTPDACLVNRYAPGTRLSLHQDRNERDFDAPIVSMSLGVPATFLFGGLARADRSRREPLFHGDVVVWGGPARLRFHGILPLEEARHPLTGAYRINLTLRKAA